MQINTSFYRRLAWRMMNARSSIYPTIPSLVNRHQRIQNTLYQLSSYLVESANIYEGLESRIKEPNIPFGLNIRKGKLSYTHSEDWNVIGHLLKQEVESRFSLGVGYTYQEARLAYSAKYASAQLGLGIGDFEAKGTCRIGLWKEEEFDPHLELSAKSHLALLSANAYGRIGSNNVNVSVNAKGMAGVVYAEATCILNTNEQTLEAGIGAAALRGEVSASFNFFGAKITVTGEGSIGSAEANLSYHHKNREWEFGSKLGFIAGLGFKIHVSY